MCPSRPRPDGTRRGCTKSTSPDSTGAAATDLRCFTQLTLAKAYMATNKLPAAQVEAREAEHGKKMIEVKLRFWTNEIAQERGKVLPKHAWSSGVVRVEGNSSHGIVPGSPKPFHSLLDIGSVIEAVLIEHEIVLHPSRKMGKYLSRE